MITKIVISCRITFPPIKIIDIIDNAINAVLCNVLLNFSW